MQVEWYGQSAFRLTDGATTVFIDPFDDLVGRWRARDALGVPRDRGRARPTSCSSPTSTSTTTGSSAIGGDPVTLRSTAGRLESPIGEVLAVGRRARRRPPARSAGPTRCSPSRSADGGSRTSATSASARCAKSRPQALGSDRPPLRARRRRTDDRRRAGRRDRRAAERRASSCRCIPHRAHRLPRAGRRLRGGARRASSGWRRRASRSTPCRPATLRSSSCPPRPEVPRSSAGRATADRRLRTAASRAPPLQSLPNAQSLRGPGPPRARPSGVT